MIEGKGYSHAVDWWALGILVYEMLIGVPPFTDPDGADMKTYQNIIQGALSSCYPADATVTDEARALIQGLCTVKVAYRLGYLKGGADDVMAETRAAFDRGCGSTLGLEDHREALQQHVLELLLSTCRTREAEFCVLWFS